MATQTMSALSTVETLLDEVEEWFDRVRKVRRKLGRLRKGSAGYLDLLPDLELTLDVLSSKVEHAHEALEVFEESLPGTE